MSQGSSFTDLVEEAKRKSPKGLPPAIPVDKSTDGSIHEKSFPSASIKPKKPIFERYDTYITCPGCGSLVPKGTKQCECGYDLSGPAVRLGRLLRRAVPALLCIVLIIVGITIGYYAGQKNMDSELENQYTLGYKYGHAIGYNDGYNVGKQVGYDAGYSTAKKEYSPPNPFSNSYDPSMPRLSSKK